MLGFHTSNWDANLCPLRYHYENTLSSWWLLQKHYELVTIKCVRCQDFFTYSLLIQQNVKQKIRNG